jgi:SAM-dependent methyltransferase
LNPTGRFTSRVEDYVRYRPSYPPEVVELLTDECRLLPESHLADVGSGTGILSKLFLDAGYRVTGVEPNAEMRAAGDRLLAGYSNFSSTDGRAESTHLADSSVDLVMAGQAFHWFDPPATRREFTRVLRTPRWVALLWNERLVEESSFLRGYEDLLQRYAPEYGASDHRRVGADAITSFFGHDRWKQASFSNPQLLDWPGLWGRLQSSSYAPAPGEENYRPLLATLERLFGETKENGEINFLHRTMVYYGVL